MPYTAQFFAEKLNIPVEYFNPFRNVQIDPSINLEELARVAHSLGEVVGLGLRNLANCPVELNLMPDSTLNRVAFNEKKPYFIATSFSLVAVVFATALLFNKLATVNKEQLAKLDGIISPMELKKTAFDKAMGDLKKVQQESGIYVGWLEGRFQWVDVCTELHRILKVVESETGAKLHIPTGVWIDRFISAGDDIGGGGPVIMNRPGPSMRGGPRGPRPEGGAPPPPRPPPAQPGAAAADTSSITIVFRGVNLTANNPDFNTSEIAFAVQRVIKESEMFDKEGSNLTGTVEPDASNGTFTFGMTVKLKRPLKL
jgi:hypothetical protein